MKTRADIVQKLGGLNPMDRKWIVDRLSDPMRRVLLAERDQQNERVEHHALSVTQAVASSAQSSAPSSLQLAVNAIEQASVDLVATALLSEPTWVAHALLQYKTWIWCEELRRTLSVRARSELVQLDACAPQYSTKALEILVTGLATQLQAGSAALSASKIDSSQIESRFEKLVGRFGAKLVDQRMRLRT